MGLSAKTRIASAAIASCQRVTAGTSPQALLVVWSQVSAVPWLGYRNAESFSLPINVYLVNVRRPRDLSSFHWQQAAKRLPR